MSMVADADDIADANMAPAKTKPRKRMNPESPLDATAPYCAASLGQS
jgi:hypothetical protein